LTSLYGNSTWMVCTGFHGVLLECWQADSDGNPHKLVELDLNTRVRRLPDSPAADRDTLPSGVHPGHRLIGPTSEAPCYSTAVVPEPADEEPGCEHDFLQGNR